MPLVPKLIFVLEDAGHPSFPVDPGYGVPLPPGMPSHPIAPGGPPPGIWPSPGHPSHPIQPGMPPHPSHGLPPIPVLPTHPIAPGGERPTHPIELPELPPGAAYIVIWHPQFGFVAVPIGDTLHPDQDLPLGPQPR